MKDEESPLLDNQRNIYVMNESNECKIILKPNEDSYNERRNGGEIELKLWSDTNCLVLYIFSGPCSPVCQVIFLDRNPHLLSMSDDSNVIGQMRQRLKTLITLPCAESDLMQRKFASELYAFIQSSPTAFVKNGGLQVLIPLLNSTDRKTKTMAAVCTTLITNHAKSARCFVIEEGLVPILDILLLSSPVEDEQCSALAVLANLSLIEDNIPNIICERRGAIIDCLNDICKLNGVAVTPVTQRMACQCLGNIAGWGFEPRKVLGMMDVCDTLLGLLRRLDLIKIETAIIAAKALTNLALCSDNQSLIGERGGVDIILLLMENDDRSLKEYGMMLLINVANNAENFYIFSNSKRATGALLYIFNTGHPQLRELARVVIGKLQMANENVSVDDDVE